MSVYKDGNKFAKSMDAKDGDYVSSAFDVAPPVPKDRAARALFEGACVEDAECAAEYEKNWKEGQKV